MTILDVSYHQGAIDFAKVKAADHVAYPGGTSKAPVEAVIVKCGGGEIGRPFTDPKFPANWRGAREAGLRRGAYFFLNAALDGEAQADHFLQAVADCGGFAEGDLLPVVDAEWPKNPRDANIDEIAAFVERVRWKAQAECIVYTGAWWWNPLAGNKSLFASCPLWLAAYVPTCPKPPSPFGSVALWQFSDKGRVDGIAGPVDLNQRFADWGGLTL